MKTGENMYSHTNRKGIEINCLKSFSLVIGLYFAPPQKNFQFCPSPYKHHCFGVQNRVV